MKIHLKVVSCSVVLTMFLLCFYMYIHIHSYFMRLTLRSSKSVFVRLFYGEKVEKEGRRELSIKDATSGDKLLKTPTKNEVRKRLSRPV